MEERSMMRAIRSILAAGLIAGGLPSALAHVPTYSEFQLQVRAQFCANGPSFNLPCGHFFANATPALNDAGQVAIKLDVIPGGSEGFQGIWFGQNGAGSIVYTSPDGALLSDPTMNNAGYVVFPQTFSSQNGLYYYDSAIDVAALRTTLPFGTSTWASAKVNDSGQIGYRTSFSGSGQAHYSLENSTLALHVAEAGLDPASPYSFIFSPAFNNQRQIASVVRLGAAGQTGNSQPDELRLFNADGSSVLIASDRDADINSPFSSFDSTKPGLNNLGQVAFCASLVGGGRGVFLGDTNGNIITIATTAKEEVSVIDFFGPAVNDHGLVAFRGRDGTLPTSRYVIYVGDGTTLRRLVGQFDQVPSDIGTAQIAQHDTSNVFGGSISINNRGDIAFHCGLTPADNTGVEWGSAIYVAYADVNHADINHDGSVGVPDLLAVINAWGPCDDAPAMCAADIAPRGGDGSVGVPDLLEVINQWGQ